MGKKIVLKNAAVSPPKLFPFFLKKPHPFPPLQSLTLIHRQHISVNVRACVALDRFVEWLQFRGVFDEREEVDEVLVFVCEKRVFFIVFINLKIRINKAVQKLGFFKKCILLKKPLACLVQRFECL